MSHELLIWSICGVLSWLLFIICSPRDYRVKRKEQEKTKFHS